jgi:ATP-binding cassette subfamily F protein 3
MIQINNISKAFSGDVLLDEANFIIAPGEKIGLIGRNGSGKSTLFRMIQGIEPVDSGDIVIPKHYTIGALDQHIEFSKPTVLEECIQSLREEEQYDHYKAEKILSGLGFSDEDFHKDPYTFSGGYQVRISLTKALLKSPDL